MGPYGLAPHLHMRHRFKGLGESIFERQRVRAKCIQLLNECFVPVSRDSAIIIAKSAQQEILEILDINVFDGSMLQGEYD